MQAMHCYDKSFLDMHFKLLFKELKDKEFKDKSIQCVLN